MKINMISMISVLIESVFVPSCEQANAQAAPLKAAGAVRVGATRIRTLFRYLNSILNFTMQKEDSPSLQNVGTYIKY
jgi:hypothetical protein